MAKRSNLIHATNAINNDRNFPTLKWVDSRKQKPPMGEEVLLTNGEGRRDIGEFFPGTGWSAHKYDWNHIMGGENLIIFWCKIPEDPEFHINY